MQKSNCKKCRGVGILPIRKQKKIIDFKACDLCEPFWILERQKIRAAQVKQKPNLEQNPFYYIEQDWHDEFVEMISKKEVSKKTLFNLH